MGENNSFAGYGIDDELNTPIISPNDGSGEISNILNEPNECCYFTTTRSR